SDIVCLLLSNGVWLLHSTRACKLCLLLCDFQFAQLILPYPEMELTQKKIRQYENRNKMLDRKLAIEKRKERNHRLCSRGGYLESLVPALIDMSEQEARDFLYTAVFSDKAQEFLRKRAGEATPKNYPCTQGRTYTP
ncbi:DUF3847 domain-containing protein, partial [Dysosmobacter segnis]